MARRGTELRTDFTGDDAKFQRTVNKQIGNAKRFGQAWETAGTKAKRSTAAIGTSLGGLLKFTAAFAGLRKVADISADLDRIAKLSKRFDIPAETLQGLGFAAELAGSNVEELAKGMDLLNRNAQEALRTPTGTQAEAFAALNIEVERFAQLSRRDQLLRFADAMERSTDANMANAKAIELLGRGGANLQVFLRQGSEVILEQAGQIKAATQEQAESIERMRDSWTKLGTQLRGPVAGALALTADGVEGLKLGVLELGKALRLPGAAEAFDKAARAAQEARRPSEQVIPEDQRRAERERRERMEAQAKAETAAPGRSLRKVTGRRDFDLPALGAIRQTGGAGSVFNGRFSALDKLVKLQEMDGRKRHEELAGQTRLLQKIVDEL